MIEIGRVVVKTAGRDAGLYGAVVEIIDDTYVLVDGQLRRKKSNVRHLEPTEKKVNIEKGASHEEVAEALNSEGIKVYEKKSKKEKKPEIFSAAQAKKSAAGKKAKKEIVK